MSAVRFLCATEDLIRAYKVRQPDTLVEEIMLGFTGLEWKHNNTYGARLGEGRKQIRSYAHG